jgi:hypothetical protein
LHRNCLLKRVTEGKKDGRSEVMRIRGRRPKKPVDDLNEKGVYGRLKVEALARTLWESHFLRGYGFVVGQTVVWGGQVTCLK